MKLVINNEEYEILESHTHKNFFRNMYLIKDSKGNPYCITDEEIENNNYKIIRD